MSTIQAAQKNTRVDFNHKCWDLGIGMEFMVLGEMKSWKESWS